MAEKKIMLGNEAIARGAWEAGVTVRASYPGTPSTEISESIVKYDEVYAQWSPITYSVRFNGNGSTSGTMLDQSFTYDAEQALNANAYKRKAVTEEAASDGKEE